jgi:hypothetical protein
MATAAGPRSSKKNAAVREERAAYPSVVVVLRNEVSMSIQEDAPGFPEPEESRRQLPPRARLTPLHDAALRLADLGFSRSRAKTRDLVGLLLCHGARAWRASQPRVCLRLQALDPEGQAAIRIRLG